MTQMQTTQTIENLKKEVNLLRSFVIGIAGKDSEGRYKPEFVTKILQLAKKKSTNQFSTAKEFLSQIRK